MSDNKICSGCVFLGQHLPHLNGHEGVDCWYECKYRALPFWVVIQAVRTDIKHNCKMKTIVKHKEKGNCDGTTKPV